MSVLFEYAVIWQNYTPLRKINNDVGTFVFVHGGISYDLANKYTIAEINNVVFKMDVKTIIKQKKIYLMKYLEMMMICLLLV